MGAVLEVTEIKRPDHLALKANYNGRAGRYRAGSINSQWVGPEKLVSLLRPHVPPPNGHRFKHLDLGVGTGEVSLRVKQEIAPDAECIGVDLSEEMLQLAVADNILDRARVGSVTDLSWCTDASQDLVTSCGVFDHLKPEDIPDLAAGMVRVTRRGGLVGFTFEADDTRNPGPQTNTRFNARYLTKQFADAGLSVIGITTINPAWLLGAKTKRPIENRVLIGRVPQLLLG